MIGKLDTSLIERLLAEHPICSVSAGKVFGELRGGRPVHPSTIGRWAMKGHQTPTGIVVKLEAFRAGKKLMTSRPAIIRFLAAQNEHTPTTAPAPVPPSPRQRTRHQAAASAKLDAIFGSRRGNDTE